MTAMSSTPENGLCSVWTGTFRSPAVSRDQQKRSVRNLSAFDELAEYGDPKYYNTREIFPAYSRSYSLLEFRLSCWSTCSEGLASLDCAPSTSPRPGSCMSSSISPKSQFLCKAV